MYEWNETVQKMIDWIELHLKESPSLMEMSRQIGYSPYYCSSQFHSITGMTLKSYIARRKLSRAALEIRDMDKRLIDIAMDYGFSSQQSLTRAFVDAYGCTPALYRKRPLPLPLLIRKEVLFPEYYTEKEARNMNKTILTTPGIRVEYIPAHQYIGIWDNTVQGYFPFWEKHNCDVICGIVESMSNVMHPVVACHTAGWFWENNQRGYCYGLGVAEDYKGEIPEGFSIKAFPGSYYLVFFHPPFDFLKDCEEVMNRVETLAWNFDPAAKGFRWNEQACQGYQRHLPETIGYEVLRPVLPL